MTRRPGPGPVSHPPKRRRPSRRSRLGVFFRTAATNGRLPAFLLSVGLSVLVYGFLFSGDFPVRSVVIEGNRVAYADSIVASSGALGESIFGLDTDEVASRVAAHPAVASAKVVAKFPDTVVVQLSERSPALVWQAGQQPLLVDERGMVIGDGDDPSLPRVIQTEGTAPGVGTQLTGELVQAAIHVENTMGPELAALEYGGQTGFVARLNDGRHVILGGSDRIPLKLSVLDAAMQLAERWSRLDVREPDRPYYQ